MRGWKNLKKDMTCQGHKFEIGKKNTEKNIEMCIKGYHFHTNPFDLFQYYPFNFEKTLVAEVEAGGEIIHGEDKSVCSEITILRILDREEIEILGNLATNNGWGNSGHCNSGHWNSGHGNSGYWNSGHGNSGDRNSGHGNSGDRNSGDRNSGHGNSGHRNSGHGNSGHWNSGHGNSGDCNSGHWNSGHGNSGYWNSGHGNSGHWNSGDCNSGHFNTTTPEEIRVFNQACKKETWEKSKKPNFIFFKGNGWKNWRRFVTAKDIKLLINLPNFDEKVFQEISGLSLQDLRFAEILFRKF